MKVGDLVKRIDNWVKCNPWMVEPLTGVSDIEEYGIIIEVPEKIEYKPSIKVLWATLGMMSEHPDDIEVINDNN